MHAREVKGIGSLKGLPKEWYAFTNLDLATGVGRSREIDVILVCKELIFLIDLKDWSGVIEASAGNWINNGRDTGPSPINKIHTNARDVSILLSKFLRRKNNGAIVPKIIGLVVVTGGADFSGVAPTEINSVLSVSEFIEGVTKKRREKFGNVHPDLLSVPLTSELWRERLGKFFNVKDGPFKPGKRRYDHYGATSDAASFMHPSDIFREYEAEEEGTPQNLGTLRLWNFANCIDGRFQTEEGRAEIAGRERKVYYFLRDRSDGIENAVLSPKAADPDYGVGYWEVYDRRRKMKRLNDFLATEVAQMSTAERIELSRQMLSKVAVLHTADASHLDIGGHSIWLERPSTVRLSHLMAARYHEILSLGEYRYQFLSTVRAPEELHGGDDLGSKRKDVYHIGVAIHDVIFGRGSERPASLEWNPSVDIDHQFESLYPWFAQVLENDPAERFPDAIAALEAFNLATVTRPTPQDVIEGLERFRTNIRSQRQLIAAYPETDHVVESDTCDSWRSKSGDLPVLVKMWKRQAWGDQTREGPRILDFLTRARDLKLSPQEGCAQIIDALWLGDALVLVQEWVEGECLQEVLSGASVLHCQEVSMAFLKRLAELVAALHERGVAHGDLKPANIIVQDRENPTPVLIDILDFSPTLDGEKVSSTYAPESGGRHERDNYAVTKITEELLSTWEGEQAKSDVEAAIKTCRESAPCNGTLLPLIEVLDKLLRPEDGVKGHIIELSVREAKVGPIYSDEGMYFLRMTRERHSVVIRGACEELEVWVDRVGNPLSARRRSIDQNQVGRYSKLEFKAIAAEILISRGDRNDLSSLEVILKDSSVQSAISPSSGVSVSQTEEIYEDAEDESGDIAKDNLAEELLDNWEHAGQVDVPTLWRELIEAERELTTEGAALADSFYDRSRKRHVVSFDLETGSFDFDKSDKVGVQKLDRKGVWRRIGELDIARSKPNVLVIDPTEYANPNQSKIVEENQRLRFTSHYEVQSFRRRESAIAKMLGNHALLSAFDPRSLVVPEAKEHEFDRELAGCYGLNQDQEAALRQILSIRPVGLLQGPPGTGKTKFIAALAHYALAKGLVRNVLLASQSHEAVNNAAEAVLKLFRGSGGSPSILRVGNESVVSEPLLPYHTERVEALYKDRLRAEFRERLRVVGKLLGFAAPVLDAYMVLETAVRPLCEHIAELQEADADEGRICGLRETLASHLQRLDLRIEVTALQGDIFGVLIEALGRKFAAYPGVTPVNLLRLQNASKLARDFMGSASTSHRSFEPFLAGTRDIVAGTCVGLGRPSLGLTETPFDLVIVDEAARCTASELSVPIQAGRWVVLVGDQAQLEPLHKPEIISQVADRTGISKEEISRSDFDRVFASRYGDAAGMKLKTQYRMLPPIGQLVSDTFYNDLGLSHGRCDPEIADSCLPAGLVHALTWMSTDSQGEKAFEAEMGKSRINRLEAEVVINLLKDWYSQPQFKTWLETQTKYPHGVGVICMYASQRDLIRDRLRKLPFGESILKFVKVDTVDSYQGKENPIVILSLVRSNKDVDGKFIKDGFLRKSNRINVAVSRAMDRLVIVGRRTGWRARNPMGRLSSNFSVLEQAGLALTVNHSNSDQVSSAREKGARARRDRKVIDG